MAGRSRHTGAQIRNVPRVSANPQTKHPQSHPHIRRSTANYFRQLVTNCGARFSLRQKYALCCTQLIF